MVAGWTEHAKYFGLTDSYNNLFGELYASWLSISGYSQWNNNRQSIPGCNGELGNYLFGTISNAECNTFCSRWNLCMVTRWTKHTEYYSEPYIYYNLFGELYASWLPISGYSQCNGNRQSCSGCNCELHNCL